MSKLHALVVSSHGSFLGWNYYKLFIEVLNKNWDLFEVIGTRPELWNIVPKTQELYASRLVTNLANVKLANGHDLFQMVTHPRFKKELKNSYDALVNSSEDSNFQMIDALAPILTKFISYLNQINPRLYKGICLQANKIWLEDLIQQYKEDDIDIVCLNGGLEQSNALEQEAKKLYGTKEFVFNVKAIESCLKFFLTQKNISTDTMMLADIYNFLPEGSTYEDICNNLSNSTDEDTVLDISNVTLIYAIAHHLVNKQGENKKLDIQDINIDFHEHSQSIIQKLGMFYILNPELLPEHVNLNIYEYHGENSARLITTIQGKGKLDKNFPENINLIALLCGHDFKDFSKPIDVAKDLNVEEFLQLRKISVETKIEKKQEVKKIAEKIIPPVIAKPAPTPKPQEPAKNPVKHIPVAVPKVTKKIPATTITKPIASTLLKPTASSLAKKRANDKPEFKNTTSNLRNNTLFETRKPGFMGYSKVNDKKTNVTRKM